MVVFVIIPTTGTFQLFFYMFTCSSPFSRWSKRLPSGFTLLELLVVLGIITLILSVGGISVMKLMEGETARGALEIISAKVGQARATAMQTNRGTGVVVYRDPATGRTGLMLVQSSSRGSMSSLPSRYRAFDQTQRYISRLGNDPSKADQVWHVYVPSKMLQDAPLYLRPIVTNSLCIRDADGTQNPPPLDGNRENDYWGNRTAQAYFHVLGDATLLPVGISAQVITGQGDALGANYLGRFDSMGIILFDPQGRLIFADSEITGAPTDDLGQALAFAATNAGHKRPLRTAIGIATFDARSFAEKQWTVADTADAAAAPFSPLGEPSFSLVQEEAEETWIADHADKFYISRYTGVISKAEQ